MMDSKTGVGITVKPTKEETYTFHSYVTPDQSGLVNKLFNKILDKDTSHSEANESIAYQELKLSVLEIKNSLEGYSERLLFFHTLEEYIGHEPKYKVSLYSRDGVLRWGTPGKQFKEDPKWVYPGKLSEDKDEELSLYSGDGVLRWGTPEIYFNEFIEYVLGSLISKL